MLQSFRELTVWQRSIQLANRIYKLTRTFPREEIYGLTLQLKRAAVSVSSNIAEGHGRSGVAEYRHFLWIARGSSFEIQSQLEIARTLDMGDRKLLEEADVLSQEVGKMLYALINKLKPNPPAHPA